MYPYLFNIERLPMYGLLMMLAAVVAIVIAVLRKRQDGIPRIDVFFCSLFAFVFGIVGAKLFSIVGNFKYVIAGLVSIEDLLRSGFVFYGGLVGGIIGIITYCSAFKFNVIKMFDAVVVGLPLAHAIGRIGCFCSGCCFGKPTNSPIGIIFTHPLSPTTPVGVPLYPTQLIEAGCLAVIFVTLSIMSRRKVKAGVLTLTYCAMYAVARFVIEFYRGDVARVLNHTLTGSQIMSLLIVAAVAATLIAYAAARAKNPVLYGRIAKTSEYASGISANAPETEGTKEI